MCLSIFYAQWIGCYLFLVSLAMLVHQQRFKKTVHDVLASPQLIILSGGLNLMFGLLIVVTHNLWISQWPVVITLLGWLLVLQGLLRLFYPEAFTRLMKKMTAKSGYLVMSWVWLIIGFYLVWVGFSS